jgi:aminoglycoside phosphotransferase
MVAVITVVTWERAMDRLLTRSEAAKVLRMSPGTLCNLAMSGRGPAYYKTADSSGGRALYREADLLAYLERRKVIPGERQRRSGRHQKAESR